MPSAVILTGATGFLGGHLLAALVEQGRRVIVLGRARPVRSLAERLDDLLSWFGLAARRHQVESIEADLGQPRCGLSEERYQAVCANRGPMVHCASDTGFSERRRREISEANLDGVGRILDLAVAGHAPFFCYVSTAFVGRVGGGRCLEELVASAHHVNVYEETKALAEHQVVDRCQRERLSYAVVRPSIVYGDSRTGRSTRFNALYHPVRSLALLREIYLKDLRSHGGERAQALGIALRPDCVLKLPLRVFVARRGHLNLIPIDYFVAAVERILLRGAPGIYHLTSDSPVALSDLADYCQFFLKLTGLQIVEGTPDREQLNPPEALFHRFVLPYLPYLSDVRSFDRGQADRATGGLQPPRFDYQIFERCMRYAVSVDWSEPFRSCHGADTRGRISTP